MQIINFKKGQIAGFINDGTTDYIRVGQSVPVAQFVDQNRVPVTPADSGNWQFTDSEDVIVDPTYHIVDGNSFVYASISGPRPKNIIRR